MYFEQSSTIENNFELNLELEDNFQENLFLNQFYLKREEINNQHHIIPCSVFRQGNSGLESIIKYLKEEKKLSYVEISKILNRDQRTIWTTYNKVKNKKSLTKATKSSKNYSFNTSIIQSRELSVLESVSFYLKNKNLSLKEISQELGRNSKTIWTALNRAEKKLKQSEVKQ